MALHPAFQEKCHLIFRMLIFAISIVVAPIQILTIAPRILIAMLFSLSNIFNYTKRSEETLIRFHLIVSTHKFFYETRKAIRLLLISEQNPEECDATDVDTRNATE